MLLSEISVEDSFGAHPSLTSATLNAYLVNINDIVLYEMVRILFIFRIQSISI